MPSRLQAERRSGEERKAFCKGLNYCLVFSTYYGVKWLVEGEENKGEQELEKYLWIATFPLTEKKSVFIAIRPCSARLSKKYYSIS